MPTHSLRSANRPRKHNKTFTGCWTCRARKVKCDEERPVCRQCRQRGIPCGGYGVRLQWMAPGTGLEDDSQGVANQPIITGSCRRRLMSGDNEDAPPSCQVDEALVAIDAIKPGRASDQGNGEGSSTFVGGFGVFDLSNSDRDAGISRTPPANSPLPSQETACVSFIPSPDQAASDKVAEEGTDSIPAITAPLSVEDICTIERPYMNPFESLQLATEEEPLTLDPFSELNILDLQGTDGSHPAQDTWEISFSPVIPRPLSPEHLSSNERLLMHYYGTTVVHLFPVLDSPKSPWKTVHLPCMLQSAGEMVVDGSTSQIRAALRTTLLSVSAFYLSKHNRLQSRNDEATKWRREAMHFHGTAMTLLKDSVKTRSTSALRPKYKEFLATMLSMISINVISGDIASCGLHLDAACRLITETAKWKTQYSNKAKALHRIYFYLRTIYESTAIRAPPIKASEADSTSPSFHASEAVFEGSQFVTSPFASPDDTQQAGAYESIYAIPKSLLVFLGKTTDLVNAVYELRKVSKIRSIPSPLAERCDELETNIMDWQADTTHTDVTSRPAANTGIIQNMTRAFHMAIIIYFAQHIRLLGHRYLKSFVEEVLEGIEAVEQIKAEWQVQASPLYWPAFIAASETFDPHLQDRFRTWYARVEPHAIGSMSPGIGLLEQVWAEGPGGGDRKTSLWRQIATRNNTALMLT